MWKDDFMLVKPWLEMFIYSRNDFLKFYKFKIEPNQEN